MSYQYMLLFKNVQPSEQSGLYFHDGVDDIIRKKGMMQVYVTADSLFSMCMINLRYISTSKFYYLHWQL